MAEELFTKRGSQTPCEDLKLMGCYSISTRSPAATSAKCFWGESDPERGNMSARTAKEAMWSTLLTRAAGARG